MAIPRLVGSAHGVVLELGPCTGNQVPRLDKGKVSHVYGIEPNASFKEVLADRVRDNGLEDRYTTVWERFEDAAPELEGLGVRRGQVDCVVSIQVMCSVDDPEKVVQECWDWLKPGGELIFLEHVGSKDPLTKVVQCE
jgi:SAM-dependent methyltransferase